MASRQQVQSLTQETICSICLDFFTEPVSLDCGHNFCRSCITQCWKTKRMNFCPECRERFVKITSKVNWALANLAEKSRDLVLNQKEKGSKLHCEKHQEGLKLFCETDKKLICYICRDSQEHKSHNFQPIDEAAEMYRDRLSKCLQWATWRKTLLQDTEQQQKWKISEVREQPSSLQTHITSEFTKMHQILTEKEQRLLRDLREEEERILEPMEKNFNVIYWELDCIEREILELEKQRDEQDAARFLEEEVRHERRIVQNIQPQTLDNGTLPLGIFKAPLQYKTWREMIDSIDPAPAPLTLDPNTANRDLILSEDWTSVRLGNKEHELPDNPERFDHSPCVLGTIGFVSGRIYWEVKVKNKTWWGLGLVKESISRKWKVKVTPETGYWTVWLLPSKGYVAHTSPSLTPLTPSVNPRKIGVFLDYEGGQVSFYNADNMSHLHTFTHTFTERVFPYFCLGMRHGSKNSNPLKICRPKAQ
ncbi:zinc-binding protein A33-like [Mustelus asterias]